MQGHIALLKRLPVDHTEVYFIRGEIRKMEAGERGENRLLIKLAELRLPGPYKVFSDVRLHDGEWKVQIDCLVVTDRCCIVLESKNISGNLYFNDDLEQFYKEEDGIKNSFSNPYYQLLRHIRFMKEFLRTISPQMKVTGAVILTAKSCRIREKPTHYPIYKLESMIEKVIQMYGSCPSIPISESMFLEIEKLILKKQSTFTYKPLCEHYRISPMDLIRGVECPSCGLLGMKRTGKTWTCTSCYKKSRDAHKRAAQDYFLLVNNKMSNKDFRTFCKVNSVYVASRMLNTMGLHVHKAGPKTFYTQRQDR